MNQKYFNHLNYTLGNEDTSLELGILPEKANHVFSVAGSGSRVIPLFAKKPKYVTCVDTSSQQLYLTELKIESLRSLKYTEFMAFWGYPPHSIPSSARKKLFQKFQLSEYCYDFFNQLFEKNHWESLLYIGRWEKTFSKLSKVNKLITGKKGVQIFEYKAPSAYFNYLEKQFPHRSWALAVFLLGNATVFNSLLYKGNFPKKNISDKLQTFYLNAFNRIFQQGPVRDNFLLQLLFFGKLTFPEGNPIECDPKVFASAQRGLKNAKIVYVKGDIIELIKKTNRKIDFISFSDVPSYFQGDIEKTFLQKIHHKLSPSCIIVIRNYLRVPYNMDINSYEDITPDYKNLIDQEKVQMYLIKVLRKK